MSDDLDSLFSEARARPPEPIPDRLMARVMADALTHLPSAEPLARPAPARPGFWEGFLSLFGGGGALAGMATAAVAGVWLGFAQPLGGDLVGALTGSGGTLDLMPGIEALMAEEELQ